MSSFLEEIYRNSGFLMAMVKQHRVLHHLGLGFLTLTMVVGLSVTQIHQPGFSFGTSPALAQRVRIDGVWRKIYIELPDLPLENQYVNRETGKVDPDNTLVSRLIRYHVYVKGRPPFYRLDWKMTLADYLGVNGAMDEAIYPSADTLRKNPTEGDVAAINRLNRVQRDALVQALVDAFAQP